MTIECVYCNNAILTNDAFLRCALTFDLAEGICDKVEYGKPHLWKKEDYDVTGKKQRRKPVRRV